MSLLRLDMVLAVAGTLSAVAGIVGCGGSSSSSSDDPVALCKQGCDKSISLCYSDGGAPGGLSASDLKSACTNACSMGASSSASSKSCSNSSQIISAYKGCLAKTTCSALMSCEQSIPQCTGSTGGGTSGTGSGTAGKTSGTSGSSGSSGGTCADLLACCNKASANLKSSCMQAYSAAMMGGGDSVCGAVLSAGKATFCP